MSEPPRIVFVCTANICRSPWAEIRARQLRPDYSWESAGTRAVVGRAMDPVMAATLPEGGTVEHRSRPMGRVIAQEAHIILTMDGGHRSFVLEEFPGAIRKTFTLGQFAETLLAAPARFPLDDLVTWCYQHRIPSGPATDVADPYGLGEAPARATADQLERLIGVLAARLPVVAP